METTEPFYIPPSVNAQGNIARIESKPNKKGRLVLRVVSGGPVFVFRGRKELAEAYGSTHPVDGARDSSLDFWIGASEVLSASTEIPPDLGHLTLHSDAETIGYLTYCYAD